ncbi:transporter family-2 protein [Nocardia kruczakiae]|uniref:Transporter family-2 protein n=1 Tax=Nocardia kruczakiae TaxID=261477 RepID=A0ABU1XCC3_9NOCA|nr:DMT family transporter [Nocardia kruczakiae]MDR7167652.1 transporter family-2 protein [Nocardia kruczakiae]
MTAARERTDVRRWIGVLLGLCCGAGVAVQARINGDLGDRLNDGIAAAVISFGSGLILLLIVSGFSGRMRIGLAAIRRSVHAGRLRWWHLLGGLCGAFFVACQGLSVATIGVTAFTIAVVAGQLTSGLVVDRLGVSPAGITPVTPVRLGAAALAVAAVGVAALGRSGGESASGGGAAYLLIALPALAGLGLAWQQAVNGRLATVGGPVPATTINFATGTAGLLVVEAAQLARIGRPTGFPTEPWLYLGGAIGVFFIAVAALIVRWIGVLLFGLTSVSGQLIGSVVLDVVAPTGTRLSALTVVGCVLTLLAAAIGVLAQGRTTERPERLS